MFAVDITRFFALTSCDLFEFSCSVWVGTQLNSSPPHDGQYIIIHILREHTVIHKKVGFAKTKQPLNEL